jgi:hypothetical protein
MMGIVMRILQQSDTCHEQDLWTCKRDLMN